MMDISDSVYHFVINTVKPVAFVFRLFCDLDNLTKITGCECLKLSVIFSMLLSSAT